MNHDELLNFINFFREKAEQGKLVLFVGAGVSCNVEGMPDWNHLIRDMAKAIGYSKCNMCKYKRPECEKACLFKNDFSNDELLKIPQYVFNQDEDLYYKTIEKSIPNTLEVDAPLSSAIFDVNPAHIITTNYDHLLETSKNPFQSQYEVIIHDKDLLNAKKSKYIIKMHGDLSEPSSLVLKENDYLYYAQNHLLIDHFIKSLWTDHIVLFLGYSLSDYNIKLILSWINHIQSQNGILDKDRRIGYLILDQEVVDDTQISYFNNNNIEVINIHSTPLVPDIPSSLTNEVGKRLYSFLRTMADSSLEKNLASIDKTIDFMRQFDFINYKHILDLLYVKGEMDVHGNLFLEKETDYRKLVEFMDLKTSASKDLKQIFLRAGVVSICCSNETKILRYALGKFSQNALFQDTIYNLYLQNQYDQIQALLAKYPKLFGLNEELFYQHILHGSAKALSCRREIIVDQAPVEQKLAYFHNAAVIEMVKTRIPFNSNRVRQFIHNLSLKKEREMFSEYFDLYDKMSKNKVFLESDLNKLKNMKSNNIIPIYSPTGNKLAKIRRFVLSQYFFLFKNHLLYKPFKEIKNIFRFYIEGLICTNSEDKEETSFSELKKVIAKGNEEYFLNSIDLDIITKFISTRELSEMLKSYDIKKISIKEPEVAFLVECFQNLCRSLAIAKTYGENNSTFSTFSNLILLLNLVSLNSDQKKQVEKALTKVFEDKETVSILFSTRCPGYKYSLTALSKLYGTLNPTPNFEIVEQVIKSNDFFDYTRYVSLSTLRHFLGYFLVKDEKTTEKIEKALDKTKNFNDKVLLLQLFYPYIIKGPVQQKYQDFLAQNFLRLSPYAINHFVFLGWLIPDQETISQFIDQTLEVNRNSNLKGYLVETRLECLYLLYLKKIIDDLEPLKELAEEKPHLQFLLDPESFDYSQVDFSDYIWRNFATDERYMDYFIDHKYLIIPKIQARIKAQKATEAEKKILYGFLMDKNEIWEL